MALPRSANPVVSPRSGRLVALMCMAAAALYAGAAIAEAPPPEISEAATGPRFTIPSDQVPPSLYRRALEHADPVARYDLARRLETGLGVPLNAESAVRLYRLSADQGYAPAQYALGRMLRTGTGIERDKMEAARRLQQAAAQGHVEARRTLAEIQGPPAHNPPFRAKAPDWSALSAAEPRPLTEAECRSLRGFTPESAGNAFTLCRNALRGDDQSLYLLGIWHIRGVGVPHDPALGVRALRLAANRGHGQARQVLDQIQALATRAPSAPMRRTPPRPPDGIDPGPEPVR